MFALLLVASSSLIVIISKEATSGYAFFLPVASEPSSNTNLANNTALPRLQAYLSVFNLLKPKAYFMYHQL